MGGLYHFLPALVYATGIHPGRVYLPAYVISVVSVRKGSSAISSVSCLFQCKAIPSLNQSTSKVCSQGRLSTGVVLMCSLAAHLDSPSNYIYNRPNGLAGRVFTNGLGKWATVPSQIMPESQKMVLDASLLNTQHYKIGIKSKVGKSKERSCALSYILVS